MSNEIWAAAGCLSVITLFYGLGRMRQFGRIKGKWAAPAWGLAFKCIPTLCAALLCLTGCIVHPDAAHWWLFAGLLFCTLADGAIDVHFLSGMGLFALGHGCYMTAFCIKSAPTGMQLAIFLLLSCALWGVYGFIRRNGKTKLPFPMTLGVLYGMVLFAMLSMALGQSILLMLGAILFVISDTLLALGILRVLRGRAADCVCLAVYYLAQYLMGLSVFF